MPSLMALAQVRVYERFNRFHRERDLIRPKPDDAHASWHFAGGPDRTKSELLPPSRRILGNLVQRLEDLEDPPDLGPDFSIEQDKAQTMAKMATCGRQIERTHSAVHKRTRHGAAPRVPNAHYTCIEMAL